MTSKDILFPHDKFRKIQESLINKVKTIITDNESLIIHAPTGIGKTASTLGPALAYALKHNLTVFFLTSRHTQHNIVLETAKKIKEKFNLDFGITSIIGKKWMCAIDGVQTLKSNDFMHYCKAVREDESCPFYSKTRKDRDSVTIDAQQALSKLTPRLPLTPEVIKSEMTEAGFCPYEISTLLSKKAKIIVADYFYLFNEKIRMSFFSKLNKKLENSIVIIDEGHNLGDRIKDLATVRLSSFIISRALKEARNFADVETASLLEKLVDIVETSLDDLGEYDLEKKVSKLFLVDGLKKVTDYDYFIENLEKLANKVREDKKISFLGVVADFLKEWLYEKPEFVRILSKNVEKESWLLSYRCLDPSIIAKEVFSTVKSTIIMSGTLTPTAMYKELLGFPEGTKEVSYPNPFPKDNRLFVVVPQTTTKFKERNEKQYIDIAEHCNKIINKIPGNVMLFFPSYFLRNEVHRRLSLMVSKPILLERPNMSGLEKQTLLKEFKDYKDKGGGCLLAITSGNFSESINLHGNYLKGVVIIGLPLQKPDLETKSLIEYYDKKFKKGWEYGYLIPAFNRVLQAAGRCIRSETDKGIIVFLDKRYVLDTYFKLFPEKERVKVTVLFESLIEDFFN